MNETISLSQVNDARLLLVKESIQRRKQENELGGGAILKAGKGAGILVSWRVA